MLHGGATEDSYHTVSDTLEGLNMEKVVTTAKLATDVVRSLANDPEPREIRSAPRLPLNRFYGEVWPEASASTRPWA